jgi:chromate reductase
MNLFAVSGSLRAGSSNLRLLEAVKQLAPAGITVTIRAPLNDLPYFNPDVEASGLPPVVAAWRAAIADCDALLISTPEYVHSLPGVMKNALDWLVGGMEMDLKPYAILNATPPGEYAQASLMEILNVMGGRHVRAASIEVPLRGSKLDADGIAANPEFSASIRRMFAALEQHATGVSL